MSFNVDIKYLKRLEVNVNNANKEGKKSLNRILLLFGSVAVSLWFGFVRMHIFFMKYKNAKFETNYETKATCLFR